MAVLHEIPSLPSIVSSPLAANQSDYNHDGSSNLSGSVAPLLRVADFDGNGKVNQADIKDLTDRLFSSKGDDRYHPLYDLNTDYKLDLRDLLRATSDLGAAVPQLDQQIARATQATMRYYGSNGLKHAIADGYLPFTQEFKGHGIHYLNLKLAREISNQKQVDIERPVGLNYDNEGNLIAVFYLRAPRALPSNPADPLQGLMVDPADDAPPDVSFDTVTHDDWHHHHSPWATGLGNLNPQQVYFEEDVPATAVLQRLQQSQFKLFPESDRYYVPKLWMLHGWFHSLNPDGVFADDNPYTSVHAPELLGDPHHTLSSPLIRGTEVGEAILGTSKDERINGLGGNDSITGNGAHDHIWGSYGNDLLQGDYILPSQDELSSSASSAQGEHPEHDDILYGGPGQDRLYGQTGDDKLFGGVNNDQIHGGTGDDVLRGGPGSDLLRGGVGNDSFVLAMGEGTSTIVDFKVGFDKLVLVGSLTPASLSIFQQQNDTVVNAFNKTIAILSGVNANQLITGDVFTIA